MTWLRQVAVGLNLLHAPISNSKVDFSDADDIIGQILEIEIGFEGGLIQLKLILRIEQAKRQRYTLSSEPGRREITKYPLCQWKRS